MDNKAAAFLGLAGFLILSLAPALAEGPLAYLNEEVEADYFSNGTLESASRTGYMEVGVPNTQDVLQYLRLNLSGTAGTTLQSATAYNSVAASPNAGDRTRIFVSTTNSTQDVGYTINDTSLVPQISFSLDYSNLNGGLDMQSGGENLFLFNLTVNCTKNISGANLTLQVARDIYNSSDAMNLSVPQATYSTTLGRSDTDSDGYFDRIDWTGNLNGAVVISFSGTTTPGVNFNETDMYLDLDPSYGINSSYLSNQTFTGIAIADMFSRGPIRQGVDMLLMDTWRVKGFIKNIASGLNYSLHGWSMYRIENLQAPVSSLTGEFSLGPGETRYTEWYDTGSSSKAYYTASFDWEVDWGSPSHSGYTRSRMKLPVLYEMDAWADKSLTLLSNTASGRTVQVNDTLRHLGHSGLMADRIEINSTVPKSSTSGSQASWQVGSVEVRYVNSSGSYNITSGASIAKRNSNSTDEGYVNVSIGNITEILNHSLGQNQDIRLSYTLSGPSSGSNRAFEFPVSSTLWTLSGTPLSKNATESITIAGLGVPEEAPPWRGGGAPEAAPVPVAAAAKEVGEVFILEKNMVEVRAVSAISDSGAMGIGSINIMVYVPAGSEFNASGLSVRLYTSGSPKSWKTLEMNKDFSITDMGAAGIGEASYMAYLIKKKEGEWRLYDGDKIEVTYRAALPIGTHQILTRISGYNYYTGKLFFEDIYTPVRIPKEMVELEPLEVKEEEFEQGIARVGKPIVWVKVIEVYNPNSIPLEGTFNATVFPDSLNAYLIEGGEEGHVRFGAKRSLNLERGEEVYVAWEDKIQGLEARRYVIEVTTPPVFEERRIVDVLESNESMVKFIINVTLINPAMENYKDVIFELQMEFEKVLQVNDGSVGLNYTSYNNTLAIQIPEMETWRDRVISVIYKEKPPVLIINLDRPEYLHNSTVNLTGIVVPAEDIDGPYLEIEAMGPGPNLETIYIDIYALEKIKKGEKIEFSSEFGLSSLPTGEYFVDVRFRKDVWTILSARERFYVKGAMPGISIDLIFFIIAAALAASVLERSYIGDRARRMLEPYMKLRRERMEASRKRLERQLALLAKAYRSGLISREAYIKDKGKIEKRLRELGERLERAET